jgi:alpha-N-arabinofuranosidase
VEPGTNPGFLYQQNTIRDAMVAGVTLNIFNRHADRVKMANIAQMVNVLQAMLLTRDSQMVKTPTYHVFQLFAVHQEAMLLPSTVEGGEYVFGEGKLPALSLSASRDATGKIHASLCNLHPSASAKIEGVLEGAKVTRISGQILTADSIQAHNTVEDPENVRPEPFTDAKATERGFDAVVPARSIVVLEIE